MEFWNVFILLFVIGESLSSNPNQCPTNFYLDPVTKTCKSCEANQIYNTTLQTCVDSNTICDKGYKYSVFQKKCFDINECDEIENVCSDNSFCINTQGSFICRKRKYCGQGYLYDSVTEECKDINECESNINPCQPNEICVNVHGSFRCRPPCPEDRKFYYNFGCHHCSEGYSLNSITRKCEDVDECVGLNRLFCKEYREICVKRPGLSACIHHCSGGTIELNGKCEDINECEMNTHNCTNTQICINSFGTFDCQNIVCHANEMVDKKTKTCGCKPGFKRTRYSENCEDINECNELKNVCGDHGKCENKNGHYKCLCDEGYVEKNGTCEDINECLAIPDICSHLICENVPGTFQCTCPKGYKKNSYNLCEDINECLETPEICNSNPKLFADKYQCFNLIGTYKCINSECPPEYQIVEKSWTNRKCQLINSKCSYSKTYGCIHTLAEILNFQVIQIKDFEAFHEIPYKVGSIDLDEVDFDQSYVKLRVRKAWNAKTKTEIFMPNAVSLSRDQNSKKFFVYINKKLPDFSEIIIDALVNIEHNSSTRIHSASQFHVIVHFEDPYFNKI